MRYPRWRRNAVLHFSLPFHLLGHVLVVFFSDICVLVRLWPLGARPAHWKNKLFVRAVPNIHVCGTCRVRALQRHSRLTKATNIKKNIETQENNKVPCWYLSQAVNHTSSLDLTICTESLEQRLLMSLSAQRTCRKHPNLGTTFVIRLCLLRLICLHRAKPHAGQEDNLSFYGLITTVCERLRQGKPLETLRVSIWNPSGDIMLYIISIWEY